jgi:archaemetzincin
MKKNLFLFLIVFACQSKSNNYFELISENDIELKAPIEGEWLYSHKEKGQDLTQFKNSKSVKPKSNCNIIYLKPIGNFKNLQKKQIEITKEYLEIFFQIKTEILSDVSVNIIPKTARRIGYESNEQLLASYILDTILKKEKHKNQIALMAISEMDLYPKPEWNYVFGLASYMDRVGVTSVYRFQDENLIQSDFNLCLSRLLKISSHEIGHMFGMHHCIAAKCVMNGTNNIDETDGSVVRLCSNCQQKINFNFQFNNNKRLNDLAFFFKKHNLNQELELINLDIGKIKK